MKRELQRLYAPKVKIILQSEALKDPLFLKEHNGRSNVDRSKEVLKEFIPLTNQIIDDDFFKTFMRGFETVSSTEVTQVS